MPFSWTHLSLDLTQMMQLVNTSSWLATKCSGKAAARRRPQPAAAPARQPQHQPPAAGSHSTSSPAGRTGDLAHVPAAAPPVRPSPSSAPQHAALEQHQSGGPPAGGPPGRSADGAGAAAAASDCRACAGGFQVPRIAG
jgi:hypothetical protein